MIAKTVNSVIERRLLVNYRISPEYVTPLLPPQFRPQLVAGQAVGGVCFIRLADIRMANVPRVLGITTENVAHRFAVEWDESDGTHSGVFVPRRDTDSWLTTAAGGRIFPGSHHRARFRVDEPDGEVHIDVSSRDGQVRLSVHAVAADRFRSDLFASFDEECASWEASPMTVSHMESSLFDDTSLFPAGTCTLDSALVMRNLPVRWTTDRSISLAGHAA
jgi:hypothetical protein